MEGKLLGAAANRVYEEVELPASSSEWLREQGYDTLIVNLQAYRKENLRIQVTSTRNIRIIGERPVSPEHGKWQRFRKEFPVPSNCDVNETSARFDKGFLYVKIPKTIAPVETAPPRTEAIPKPQKPTGATQPAPAAPAQKTNAPAAQEQVPPSKAIKEKSGSKSTYNAAQVDSEKEKEFAAGFIADQRKPQKVHEEAAEDSINATSNKQTSTQKEKSSDGLPANAQIAEQKSPTTEDGKRVDQEYSTQGASSAEYCSRRTQGRGYYRQVVDGLFTELKEPRRLVNLVLAVGFILVLGLYVKHAVNFIQEFKHQEL